MKRRLLLPLLLLTTGLSGDFNKVGTTTAQFLKLGAGARAMAMGGAGAALTADGYSAYWNPAGLALVPGPSLALARHEWVLDITHQYAGVVVPAGKRGAWGLAVTALTMDEKEVTTVREPDGTGLTYAVLDLAVSSSYALRVSDRLAWGGTLKYIRLAAYNEVAQTAALDMGLILRTDFYGLSLGMALSNFGGELRYSGRDLIDKADTDEALAGNYLTDVNLRTEAWPLPLLIRIGTAIRFLGTGPAVLNHPVHRVTLALDAVHPNDHQEHLNLGIEYAFQEWLYLRGGKRLNYDFESFTLGAGLRLPLGIRGLAALDYAVMPLGPFGQTSQISLELRAR